MFGDNIIEAFKAICNLESLLACNRSQNGSLQETEWKFYTALKK